MLEKSESSHSALEIVADTTVSPQGLFTGYSGAFDSNKQSSSADGVRAERSRRSGMNSESNLKLKCSENVKFTKEGSQMDLVFRLFCQLN